MAIHEELLEAANKLDYIWYSKIKSMFLTENNYDSNTGLVKGISTGYHDYINDEGEHVVDEGKVDCDLKKYCWEYDYENNICPEDDFPAEGIRVAMLVESIIAKYIVDFVSPQDDIKKNSFVTFAYNVVRERLLESKEAHRDTEYKDVLVYFFVRLKKRLLWHYGKYKEKANRVESTDVFLQMFSNKVKKKTREKTATNQPKKITFGFKEDKNWLQSKLNIAQLQWDLLQEDKCTLNDLTAVILSKDLSLQKADKIIHLGCELTDFAYFLEKLKSHCTQSPVNTIGKAGIFYSKNGTIIKSNNLHQAKNQSAYPKHAEEINKLFAP